MKRYNEEVMADIEKICLNAGDVSAVSEEDYAEFVKFPDKMMELLIFAIVRGTVDYINKKILSGEWASNEDINNHIMMFLQLIAEGKMEIGEKDGKLCFFKALGKPPTKEMRDKIDRKIESCRPLIRKVLCDIILDQQLPER